MESNNNQSVYTIVNFLVMMNVVLDFWIGAVVTVCEERKVCWLFGLLVFQKLVLKIFFFFLNYFRPDICRICTGNDKNYQEDGGVVI